MDGLYEIVPGCVSIGIGGGVWQISPLRLADYAAMERELLRRRRPRVNAARDAMLGQSEERLRQMMGVAFDELRNARRASREELEEWLRSDEGILFEFWLRLKPMQPSMTLAVVERLFLDRIDEASTTMASRRAIDRGICLGKLIGPRTEVEPSVRGQPIPWRRIFRSLIQAGVRPESVGTLTPAQLQIILLQPPDAGATVELTPLEAEEFCIQRTRQKELWIEEQLAHLQHPNKQRHHDHSHQGLEMLASIADHLTDLEPPSLRHAARLHRATGGDIAEIVRREIRGLQTQIDELLAKSLQPNSVFHRDIAPHFSDGP